MSDRAAVDASLPPRRGPPPFLAALWYTLVVPVALLYMFTEEGRGGLSPHPLPPLVVPPAAPSRPTQQPQPQPRGRDDTVVAPKHASESRAARDRLDAEIATLRAEVAADGSDGVARSVLLLAFGDALRNRDMHYPDGGSLQAEAVAVLGEARD
eukprot:CAMPEP_0194289228 /NCGR_PEP_ID=MMETSP0169-20130528/38630_1 /TAXON_ID=218684 /ORGANISM="Corethron pennatum, Strain L29A3" /LENGTH=153 /DNA_ID=CAMNT_0039036449 /DNA_START=164 /DNA_END=622 /DNA_ORIENTATION=+